MAAISVFQRKEKKYRMSREIYERILPLIRQNMEEDRYCIGGRSYQICNLYYDTENNDVIRESLKKPFFKEKLRMRSYGYPESEETEVFLELKRKINGVVAKRRATLPYGTALRFMEDRVIPEGLSYINRQVLSEIREYLSRNDITKGTLLTYDRSAWFGKEDPRFRVTFDWNLRYRRHVRSMDSKTTEVLMPGDFILMEAKVEGAFPLWFARMLGEEGIRRQSFSKYGVVYKTCLREERFDGDESIDILGRL